jgi:imidazolonepropionase-like amidohydrolase
LLLIQMKMKKLITLYLLILVSINLIAQDKTQTAVIIKNANIFDGVNEKLITGSDVLVEDNLIKKIGKNLSAKGATIIDAQGKTLIPGLIDVHWHSYYANVPVNIMASGDMSEVAIIGMTGAKETLMRGFTTIRDIGGNPFAVKKFADAGTHPGPRMYISGPPISQTGGHFDFRGKNDVPSNSVDLLPYWERVGLFALADGVPEVVKRTRENLRMGATQIKIAGGGGVTSLYDPVDVQEYTFEEMKAIVDVAKTWNTYVAAHIFTDAAIQTAIRAGIKSIEHGKFD